MARYSRRRGSRRTVSRRRARPIRRARRSYTRSFSRGRSRRRSAGGRTLRIVFEQPGGVGGIGRVAPGMLDAAGVVRQAAGSPKKAKF